MSSTDRLADRLASLSPEQRALFERLREKRQRAARLLAPPPVPRVSDPAGTGEWPLSLDQERFWFMEQLYASQAGLNITAATRMRGPLVVPAIAAGLAEIARRHAAWRTTFPVEEGRPLQRVAPPAAPGASGIGAPPRLALVDLAALPAARREAEVLAIVAADTAGPFDLERGPLLRATLVRLAAEDHACILTIHHLVTDWISFQIAWGELAAIYGALAAGRRPALPPPPVQYSDFAIWQRSWLQGEVEEELVSWWRERLAGVPAALELPTDRPRPASPRLRGGRVAVEIPGELADGLRALGRAEGATVFMTVLAAIGALLCRDSGQETFVLGANNANRNRPEIEPVLGCFLTQVPFVLELGGDPTVRELLGRVRRSAIDAYAHQDLPFGKLVEAIDLRRDPSRQPLIQNLVQVLDGQYSKTKLAGVEFEAIDSYDGRARYDLMLSLFDYPTGLAGSLEYDADLFDRTTTLRRVERLLLQIAAAVADPGVRLSALPVLSAAARQQALVEWSDSARPRPDWTVPARFAAQAAATPAALAVVGPDGELTYGELDRRAGELARRLLALGVGEAGAEPRVALLLGRTIDVPVAILGVWKAGAAYVPLDPDSPPGRLAGLLDDAAPAALVHRGPLPLALPAGMRGLDLAAETPAPGIAPLPAPSPARLAYMIYTSGTTGRPKAVMIEHGQLAATLAGIVELFGLGPGDRVPHIARYTFDASLLDLVAPLLAGASVELLTEDEILDPERLTAALARATAVFSVPALLRRAAAAARERGPEPFSRLRFLAVGADVVPPELQEDLLHAFPAADLHVAYGPTEATILCAEHPVSRLRRPSRALIGRPLSNVALRVVDPRGADVAPGIPGELWVGGPIVGRGYFRREELTAERFVAVDGRRFYRTGDLVRQVPDEGGALEFLGRTDFQVKVRGFRIEPGEVEAAILSHPGVRETVVVAHAGPSGESQLVAYVVGGDGGAGGEALRAHLRTLLPEHMVPAFFVPMAELPLNRSGKVDRAALPAPAVERLADAGSAPPRDAREELLAEIWRSVLGVDRVGIHDNFFQLGGDSILSIQVVARARRAGLLVTPRQLFDHQTIAGLAAAAGAAGESPDAGAEQGPVEGEAPLTPIQRRFLAEPRREPWRFNQALLLTPREPLAPAPLAAALARLAAHHDALRLRFVRAEEGGWRQVHAPAQASAASAPLAAIDLSALPAPRRRAALEAVAEELQSGLDLARGPLFTAALASLGEGGQRLLLTAHHLIVDGVSWRVLVEDLIAAYRREPALPPKTTSWKRWTELLAAHARSPELAAELPYWSALPRSVPPLPADLDEPPGPPRLATASAELSPAATRALLQEAPAAYRTQVNDLLLAALARAFAAWTGERRLLVDLEGHGREEIFPGIDLSRTVGWFTTIFPVALALPAGDDPRDAIRAVKEQLRAVPGRGLGYGLLRYLAAPEAGARLASLPAAQVSFNYLGQVDQTLAQGGLFALAPEAVSGAEGEAVRHHAFSIDALVAGDRLRITWSYDPGRHLPATAERLAQGFAAEVAALVAHCLSPAAGGYSPSDFPLAGLDPSALDRLLGNDTDVEDLYPLAPLQEGMLFHSLYAAGSELYVEQLTAELLGPLDVAAFAGAWRRAVERHGALRTAFVWRDLPAPLQLVRREAELPFAVEDWRGLSAGELAARWEALQAADRARGFDLGRPPLTRLSLVRTGENAHRLLWSFHHLIFDGWCFSLLLGDVFALYEAMREGRPSPLAPPPRPYRDYIAWLAGRDAAEAEGYWRRALRGFTVPTPVPFDRAGWEGAPSAPSGSRADDYHERTIALPALLYAALEALAQRLQTTLNTLVQGAWALLLARYAQADEAVFGAVVSGRPPELPGVESMVGLFINTLPVRVAVPEGEPAAAWLPRLQAAQFELRQHEWTPLARVQALAETPAGEPLFQSLLAFENYPVDPAVAERLGELAIGEVAVSERTNYPLTLTVVARGDLALRLTADRRFDPATARRILAHLENLLAALSADPERPPRKLPFLSAGERHQTTIEWNDTASDYPAESSLPALFAEQAARRPEATALLGEGFRLTYRELDAWSDALAAELAGQGVGRGDLVALFAERSPELVAALLAVSKLGAAYAPLDPSYPRERLSLMLADTGAARVLAQPGIAGRLPVDPARILPLEPRPAAPRGARPRERPGAGDLAYVIYTSGSTGTPKGVAVPHRAVVRLVRGTGYASFGPDEVFLMMAPASFDASTFEVWGPLLNGGALAIPPPGEVSLDALERAIRGFGVTTLWLTAGLFHLVVDERPAALAPLRQLLAGGDVLSPAHVARLRRELPGLVLINGYGPTENTTFTATHRVTNEDLRGAIPIGRPIANGRALLLDGEGEPAPIGVPAELYAGGAGLAHGYLGRPELTAAAFVPDPVGEPGERLYRTGDLARRLADGRLEFLGRADAQVKVRGFRIEPGEIEALLAAHPAVAAAAVVARTAGEGRERRLAAFAVPRAAGTAGSLGSNGPDTAEVLAWLAERLPAYMVPAELAWLPELPLSPTGKVDRRALAAIDLPGAEEPAEPELPRTAAEAALLAVWRQVLGRERIGVEDDFFQLGGDSILSIQVVARARQAGWVITPRQIFEEQTVAAVAALATPLAAAAAEQGPIEGDVPLTPVQRWFLGSETAAPADPHHFNQSLLLAPRGPLAPAPLARSLAALVGHHDALRLRLLSADGGFRAWNAPAEPRPPLALIDLAALPSERRAAALSAAAAALQAGFDLARGPLFRAAHFALGVGDMGAMGEEGPAERLFLVAHHLVVDGVSWRILLEDLETAYGQAAAGRPIALPPKTTSWKSWAERLARSAAEPEVRAELPYWLAVAESAAAVPPLPRDGAEGAAAGGERGAASVSLDRETTRALLEDAPAAYRTQVNDLLLAALALAFARWTRQDRLVLDLEGHGREEIAPEIDLSRTVGWFTAIFPVALPARLPSGHGAPPEEVLRAVKETLRAVPRRGIGYGLLRYLGAPEDGARLAAMPDPEVAFNYLGQLDGMVGGRGARGETRFALAPEPAGPDQSPRARPRHPLEVNAWVLDGELRASFAYDPAQHAAATVEALARDYAAALAHLVALCTAEGAGGATPSDFPLAGLGQEALDDLLGTGPSFDRAVEDLYPLAPLQGGMLFQGLYAPGSELYFEHLTVELVGGLDVPAFVRAWQGVVDRHPALRTAFADRPERPLQVVRRGVELPWTFEDWRQVPAGELPARLDAWLAADRARPFDLARPPLLRAALLRTGEDRHRFVWSFHHLLLDGWCFSLVFREVFALYRAAVGGGAAELAPVRPYRDFIAWTLRQDAEAAEGYFRRSLAGFLAPTPLPLDREAQEAPPGERDEPRHQEARLPAPLAAGLHELARSRGLTLASLAQAAWVLLLARYGGTADVVFGSVVSGRPAELPGVESMVGLFINTLPARLAVDPAARLDAWLAEVQERLLELRQRETVSLARIQRLSEVPAGEPLFRSFVAFENYPVEESLGEGAGDLSVREVTVSDRTEYPLSLAVLPGREAGRPELALRLAHDRRADATTVRRLLGHLELLLGAFAAAPEARLGDLPALAEAERHQLLVEWAAARDLADLGDLLPVPLALAARAASWPAAPAVLWAGETLSHGELDRRAGELARRLRAAGIGAEAVVGLRVERSLAIPVGLLGIWKAGAAFLPLDPALPPERLGWLLADSGARAVVTEERLQGDLPPFAGPVLALDGPAATAPAAPITPADSHTAPVSPHDLAYLIYTSGTTGLPKAVMVEHGSLARILAATRRELGWEEGEGRERMPAVAPFSFDIFLFELLAPLLSGGACELLPIAPAPDVDEVLAALSRATRFHAVPALMRQIAAAARRRERPADCRHLRAVYLGGDAVPPRLLAELREAFPAAAIRVLYGPTEGTILAASFAVPESLPARSPLGRPLPGVELRLYPAQGAPAAEAPDAAGSAHAVHAFDTAPAPLGVPGEIWLGGVGVARGYLGRDELTAKRFVRRDGRLWYRTGDLARFLPDGNLEFLGRADAQLKVRGFRVEPGEIEAALARHPGVVAAAVTIRDAGEGNRQLVACVVPRQGADLDSGELARFLGGWLPEHLIPADFVPLAELPLTRHGKVDRWALPALAAAALSAATSAAAGGESAAPRTPAEVLLAGIWREVLRLDRLGVHDDFFRLGGDSILSIQVVARARQAGLALTPRQLFENPTVAALAAVAAPSAGEGAADAAADEGPIEGEAPLSPIQHDFLERGRPEPHRFNQSLLLAVSRPAAAATLLAAAAALARHHDALRLRFARGPAGWRQSIAPADDPRSVALLHVDLSALPAERLAAAIESATDEVQGGLDLGRGPLFAAALFATGAAGRDRLFLAAHHLTVDAVSWRLLLADLETACGQIEAGEEIRLPRKTTSWKRWTEGLAAAAGTAETRAELPSWLAMIGAAPPPLPADGPGGDDTAGGEASVASELSPELTAALLKRAPAAYRTRADELLLAALALAFARWTGEPRLLLDLEGHGREAEVVPGADLSRTVGWFTALYPVLLDLPAAAVEPAPEAPALADAIRAVKERLRAVPRGGVGYGLLRHLDGAEAAERLAALPAPEVAFNNLGQLDGALAAPGSGTPRFALADEAVGAGESRRAPRRHRIEIGAMVLGDRLRLDWRYGLWHRRATIERLARGFEAALAELVDHCLSPAAGGVSPADFPLAGLGQADLDALVGVGPALDRTVEDLYPLAPLQEGMLFRGLLEPAAGFYLEQLTCTLEGPLDTVAFRRAWQATIDRHPALRTAFLWEGLERPLQVVRSGVLLPWSEEDLRRRPDPAAAARERAAEEWGRPFELGRAPLMRALLLRTGEAEHRFVWSYHHLLFDGWCFSLLLRDVFELYKAALAGRTADLPPVRPYRDFIAWVMRRDPREAAEYFRRTLAGFAEPTPLPLDRPLDPSLDQPLDQPLEAAAVDAGPREEAIELSRAVAAGLGELAESRGLTASTLVQGAWALLLARVAGERDVVFGTVVSGRPAELPGVESMIGLFINTLPARFAVDPRAPLAAWLAAAQERLVELRQHETAALALVQRASEVPPGEALFQSLVAFENYPVEESLGEGLRGLSVHDLTTGDRSDYPLALTALPGGAPGRRELALRLSYDRRTDATTARRLLGHLERLLAAFAADPERALGDLPMLGEAERHQLVVEWNDGDPAPAAPGGELLHGLVAAQARRTPGSLALLAPNRELTRELTYAELDRRARSLASRLRSLGVGPEARVALVAERSAEMVVAVLGVLAAGAAYVPIDPETPADRLAFFVADARPALLLASDALAARLAEDLARAGAHPPMPPMPPMPPILPIGDLLDEAGEPASGALPEVDPESLAYVIYTSGSTGTPKGVAVAHRSAAAYVREIARRYALAPGDRELQFASLSFDPSVEEIFAPLAAGAAVVLRTGAAEEPARFLAASAAQGITVLSLPTAYWHQVAAAFEGGGLTPPPGLRLVVVGGERTLPERWAGWARGTARGVRLVNAYGPTEATIAATLAEHPRAADPLAGRREVPIGRPLPGWRAHVVDRDLCPAPAGAPGELLLGGVGLARGYLDRPDLTAERFVPDPFSTAPGARLYRTGDLVCRLPDGTLEFAGRIDTQVKVRGFRIELGEIEAALATHPSVREAAAGTRDDASGNRRLVGYVVLAEPAGRRPEGEVAAELRAFVAGRLPAYMVPSQLVVLPALPLTATDKVDRRALALLAPEAPREERAYRAPRNPVEERLAAIWSELLRLDWVGLDDDFFALGGHSLLATQLASRLRRDFQIDLPLSRLFELRRLEDLAGEVLERTLAQAAGGEMDELIDELDGLSDEEALALLAEEGVEGA